MCTFFVWFWGGRGNTDKGEGEDGRDSPQPVGAIGCEEVVTLGRVDLQRIVVAEDEEAHCDGVRLKRMVCLQGLLVAGDGCLLRYT